MAMGARRTAALRGKGYETARGRRRVRSRRRIPRSVWLVLVLLVAAGGFLVYDAYASSYRAYREIKQAIPLLTQVRASFARGQAPGTDVQGVVRIGERASSEVDRSSVRVVARIPFLGRPAQAAREAAAALVHESRAAQSLGQVATSLLGPPADGEGERRWPVYHDGAVDLKLLEGAVPDLERAVAELRLADAAVRRIPQVPFLQRVDRLKAEALLQSSRAIRLAEAGLNGARLLPRFLGGHGPKTYYLAMQNNADQRATGGDVLAYAFVKADRGKLQLVRGGGIAELAHRRFYPDVELSPEMEWYMEAFHHPKALANMNLAPDFPLVAQSWARLIAEGTGVRVDGAIALDPVAVSYLMGDRNLHIPSYPGAISAGNLVRVVENEQYRLPKEAQDEIPGQLIAAFWPLVEHPDSIFGAVKAFGRALAEKHLQLWSADGAEQAALRNLRWDGGVHAGAGDYLNVVDNHRASNKIDYYMRFTIHYDVTISDDGSARAVCRVVIHNRIPPNQPPYIAGKKDPGTNRTAISLYVPERAVLEESVPPSGPSAVQRGLQVFVRDRIWAAPGQRQNVSFSYRMPRVILETGTGRTYRLTVQHQAMVAPVRLVVSVHLPSGATVRRAPGWNVQGNVATLETVLARDLVAEIVF